MGTGRFAFPALVAGSAALAFGPWMVRLADVGPIQSAWWRLALAAPVLVALAAWRGPAPARRVWPALAWAGGFFAADLAAWHAGITRTTMANATLLANGSSLMFPLWGYLVARAWPGARIGGALAVAAAGAALLMGRSFALSANRLAGDLLCLAAAVFYTGYLVVMGRVRGATGAMPALAAATVAGAVALAPLALFGPGAAWPVAWGPLIWLALGSQVVGQGLIIYAVGHLPAHVSGLGLLVQPVIGATIGWAAYGEAPGPMEAAGMAMVLGALVWVRLTPDRPAAIPDAARDIRASPRAGRGRGR